MENRFAKYLRLFGSIFFSVIGFIVVIILLLLGIKLLFGVLEYVPWFTYVYMSFILLLPATLFITVYIIYFKRTVTHFNKPVRWISYFIFSIALAAWVIYLVLDIITFYKHAYSEIGMYNSYSLLFFAGNVACIFFVGIMQAFATPKEKDWMEKRNSLPQN